MDFLGEIGGVVEIVFVVGTTFTAAFVTRSMNFNLVQEAYQVQRYDRDFT